MKLLCTIFLFFVLTFGHAQMRKTYQSRTTVGIETGFNFNQIDSEIGDYDARFSVSPAFLINTKISRKFFITYGLRYIRKGAEADYIGNRFFNGEIDYNLYYLEFPININYYVTRNFYVKGGLFYGRLVDASFNYDGFFINGFGQLDEDEFQQNDMGLTVGVGFKVRRFHFGLQFQRSFINLADGASLQNTIGDSYNRGFAITVSRFFR